MRVYELAKELGVESKVLIETLNDMGEFVRSASSTIEPAAERRIRERFAATLQSDARSRAGTSGALPGSPGSKLLSPVDLVQPGCRLFIDTNVFMDTHPARAGGLKRMFELSAGAVRKHGNPVIVPSKVVDELSKQSRIDSSGLAVGRVKAVEKAKNALVFIEAAERQGLVRRDLGDGSNPYADDLFVKLFETFGGRYRMSLLTLDITLLLRIRLLAKSTGLTLVAGRLTKEGLVDVDSDQELYEKGLNKFRQKSRLVADGTGKEADRWEAAVLEPLLAQYQRVFGTETPSPVHRDGYRSSSATSSPATATRGAGGAFDARARLQARDQVFPVAPLPSDGDEVWYKSPTGRGRLVLREELGAGGEGTVFAVDGHRVAKIFDAEHVTGHRREKLNLLVSRGLKADGICFPEAIVANRNGEFVGYLMPLASGRQLSSTIFRPKRFRQVYPNWSKGDLVDVCISFLEKVAYLHRLNIILGDINPKNLLVDADKQVWFIDADSWQLEGYPCPVGTAMFTAPAISGKHYPEFLRTMEDERFAVATMLFMILITGQFPYARAGSDGDIVRLIRDGNFAFQYKENSNKDQPEGNWKYMWSHLHPRLKEMFWNTFHHSGSRYRRRPSAEEWLQIFRNYKTYLGSNENFDPMSNDVYPTRFKAFRPDTPIYACLKCLKPYEVTGIWQDDTQTYDRPNLCFNCRSSNSSRFTPPPTSPISKPRPVAGPPAGAPRRVQATPPAPPAPGPRPAPTTPTAPSIPSWWSPASPPVAAPQPAPTTNNSSPRSWWERFLDRLRDA